MTGREIAAFLIVAVMLLALLVSILAVRVSRRRQRRGHLRVDLMGRKGGTRDVPE